MEQYLPSTLEQPTLARRPATSYRSDGYLAEWRGGAVSEHSTLSDAAMAKYGGFVTKNGNASLTPAGNKALLGDLLSGRVRYKDILNRNENAMNPDHNPEDDSHHSNPRGGGADLTQSGEKPIILDLDGNGIQITDITQSTTYVDGGDGLEHRTAWAGAGDGVLFYDPDGTGEITEMRQYVFTEWDPTAASDMEALASVFDSNGDGVLVYIPDGTGGVV